jgi:hypothetical protein
LTQLKLRKNSGAEHKEWSVPEEEVEGLVTASAQFDETDTILGKEFLSQTVC